MEKVFLFVLLLFAFTKPLFAQSSISVRSDNTELVEAFEWAKGKALSFVMTGKHGPINIYQEGQHSPQKEYIPSYWAGYPLRSAFYSRDFCHQIVGAHLLGLEEENFAMMAAFARSATASRKWYPLWAINFDGSPYTVDYRNDNDFVREIPAVFELVEKNMELYRWTGDRRYLKDDAIANFLGKAVNEFIELHDSIKQNGVAESTGTGNIFVGTATYNERADHALIEAGDGIASQFKAFGAYSEFARLNGEKKVSRRFKRKADELKKYFNSDWGVFQNQTLYNRGYDLHQLPVSGWGRENSWFMPLKEITDVESPRHRSYLDFIDQQLSSVSGRPENIEAITYIPELYFKYGHIETGWKWMKYIMSKLDDEHEASSLTGQNGNYPEVSFVLIQNIVQDIAGVAPGDSPNSVHTCSHLPKEIGFLGVDSLNIRGSVLSVDHYGLTESKLRHISGDGSIRWRASFPGSYTRLWINGRQVKSKHTTVLGQVRSYVDIEVGVGDEAIVSTSAQPR